MRSPAVHTDKAVARLGLRARERASAHTWATAKMTSMNIPDGFEIVGRRAFYRPVGTVSGADAVTMVAGAIAYARERGASELLANVCGLAGFAAPNLTELYFLAQRYAVATAGRIRVALVDRAERIHPRKFGVTVAVNRGAVLDVFATDAEALTWLDGRTGTAPP